MAVLTIDSLVTLRQALAVGANPSWLKTTANTAFQSVEDALEALAFDPETQISVGTIINARAQAVKDQLNSVSPSILPIVEDWLEENPPSRTTRAVNTSGLDAWVRINVGMFSVAVSGMPADQHERIIRLVALRRVERAV